MKRPKGASLVMKTSVSYASSDDAMYEKASVTPLATCTMNASSVALPNTYHQRAPRGTGCSRIGASIFPRPRRSSSTSRKLLRNRAIMAQSTGSGAGQMRTWSPLICTG